MWMLITGASSGIGRATAIHLARRGHHVIAAARRPGPLQELVRELPGDHISPLVLDVTDASSIARAKAEVDVLTGGYGVDVLINSAGIGAYGPLELIACRDVRTLFETNVLGVLAMIQAFVPQMRARGRGRIVNISSIGGRIAIPLLGAYNATKFALEAMSDSLRNEIKRFGVDVCIVEPGPVRSHFAERALIVPASIENASPYAASLRGAALSRERFQRRARAPELVASVVARAALAAKARPRYVVPWIFVLIFWVLRFIPTVWIDRLKRRALAA